MTFLMTAEDFRDRWQELRDQIVSAGGSLDRVRVVAVTKTFPTEAALLALGVGLLDLGENYGQELESKAPRVAALLAEGEPSPRWHFIGGLQRNKVKRIASLVALWQTVDRVEVAGEIASRAPGAAVLIQVNTTDEQQKSGCQPKAVAGLVDAARTLGLDVRGLMTIGPTDGLDPRPAFAALRALADRHGLVECSMGMSSDIAAAVAEGSTMVRVGTHRERSAHDDARA
ncbi:MAG: YggS family pyridoxal phosphate-dependent enzyme [Actinomycetota bacterium]|nr:YggS family pyridoxal phosphate-dependent enzyme [Actinomycetota bacterium]